MNRSDCGDCTLPDFRPPGRRLVSAIELRKDQHRLSLLPLNRQPSADARLRPPFRRYAKTCVTPGHLGESIPAGLTDRITGSRTFHVHSVICRPDGIGDENYGSPGPLLTPQRRRHCIAVILLLILLNNGRAYIRRDPDEREQNRGADR